MSRYGDQLPLHRQTQIYAREGAELDYSTLAEWVGQSSALLRPPVEALRPHLLGGKKLHAGDTRVLVLCLEICVLRRARLRLTEGRYDVPVT